MSRCKLRTPWPIHFKLRTVIGIDSLTVCILFGKLKTPWPIRFKLRIGIGIVGLYTFWWNFNFSIQSYGTLFIKFTVGDFFVCHAVNWEPLGQFTSNFSQLLELIVLRSVYFLVKSRFFHSRVMGLYSSNCRQFFVCRVL